MKELSAIHEAIHVHRDYLEIDPPNSLLRRHEETLKQAVASCPQTVVNTAIEVVNQNTLVSDKEIRQATAAIQKQLANHFGPAWGFTSSIAFVKKRTGNAFPCFIKDVDSAGINSGGGYHTAKGEIFVFPKIAGKKNWVMAFSHEVLEFTGNPSANLWQKTKFKNKPLWVLKEACDAVAYETYDIDGLSVANFVTPDWFNSDSKAGKFDHLGNLSGPLTFGSNPACFISCFRKNGQWLKLTSKGLAPEKGAPALTGFVGIPRKKAQL